MLWILMTYCNSTSAGFYWNCNGPICVSNDNIKLSENILKYQLEKKFGKASKLKERLCFIISITGFMWLNSINVSNKRQQQQK